MIPMAMWTVIMIEKRTKMIMINCGEVPLPIWVMPKRKGVFSGMPSLMMTILNLLMASGGEDASVLDRVHCIHYLTDFLSDFSHLRNTSL